MLEVVEDGVVVWVVVGEDVADEVDGVEVPVVVGVREPAVALQALSAARPIRLPSMSKGRIPHPPLEIFMCHLRAKLILGSGYWADPEGLLPVW